jgi:hypothetical protein
VLFALLEQIPQESFPDSIAAVDQPVSRKVFGPHLTHTLSELAVVSMVLLLFLP